LNSGSPAPSARSAAVRRKSSKCWRMTRRHGGPLRASPDQRRRRPPGQPSAPLTPLLTTSGLRAHHPRRVGVKRRCVRAPSGAQPRGRWHSPAARRAGRVAPTAAKASYALSSLQRALLRDTVGSGLHGAPLVTHRETCARPKFALDRAGAASVYDRRRKDGYGPAVSDLDCPLRSRGRPIPRSVLGLLRRLRYGGVRPVFGATSL